MRDIDALDALGKLRKLVGAMEEKHLPGEHDQGTHGNRYGANGNATSLGRAATNQIIRAKPGAGIGAAGGMSNEAAAPAKPDNVDLAMRLLYNRGFTLNAVNGEIPKTGFMVSLQGNETKLDPDNFAAPDIQAYIDARKDTLAKPEAYLGGWFAQDVDGMFYLDVSVNVATEEEAQQIGADNNQFNIFDLAKGISIPVKQSQRRIDMQKGFNMTPEQTDPNAQPAQPEQGKGPIKKYLFPKDASADEICQMIKDIIAKERGAAGVSPEQTPESKAFAELSPEDRDKIKQARMFGKKPE